MYLLWIAHLALVNAWVEPTRTGPRAGATGRKPRRGKARTCEAAGGTGRDKRPPGPASPPGATGTTNIRSPHPMHPQPISRRAGLPRRSKAWLRAPLSQAELAVSEVRAGMAPRLQGLRPGSGPSAAGRRRPREGSRGEGGGVGGDGGGGSRAGGRAGRAGGVGYLSRACRV